MVVLLKENKMDIGIIFIWWFIISVVGFIINFIAFRKTFVDDDEYNLWIDENSTAGFGVAILCATIISPLIYGFFLINLYDIFIGKDNNLIQVIFKIKKSGDKYEY